MIKAVMNLISLLFQEPLLFFVIMIAFLAALTVHEASHALAGYMQGDLTAKRQGRLTLNPFAHVDFWGFLALITVGFGWGKPVPYNPYNLRYPRLGPVLVAVAGPAANLILGVVFGLLYRLAASYLDSSNLLAIFLSYGAYLNFLLCLFNLIPIPPLDGSKALLALLAHPRYRAARFFLETQGPIILICLIVIDALSGIGIFSSLSHGANALMQLVTSL